MNEKSKPRAYCIECLYAQQDKDGQDHPRTERPPNPCPMCEWGSLHMDCKYGKEGFHRANKEWDELCMDLQEWIREDWSVPLEALWIRHEDWWDDPEGFIAAYKHVLLNCLTDREKAKRLMAMVSLETLIFQVDKGLRPHPQ